MKSAPAALLDEPRAPMLGRYRIFDEIGVGGMARVHLAVQRGAVGFARIVALKRLHPHLLREPRTRAMFLDEARVSTFVDDPHVARVIDVVEEDGDVGLVMEYVAGASLAVLSRMRERVPRAIAIAILLDVLAGLHAAHEARDAEGRPLAIVHRDVSPQNVIVGVDGRARVIDFGIAKAAGQTSFTASGETKGKETYMAPEQLRAEPVSRVTDVYGAGVVAWELLTGTRLFADGAHLVERINGERATPIEDALRNAEGNAFALDDLGPRARSAIVEAVTRALEPRERDRHPTARAFADALRDAVSPATRDEVATWVRDRAADTIDLAAERCAEILRLDATEATRASATTPKKSRRGLWIVGTTLVVAAAAIATTTRVLTVRAARETPREDPVASVAPSAEPPPSVPPSAPPPAAIASAAPSVTTSATARARHPSRAACTPPYVIDAAGRKIYRAECFGR